VTVKPWGIQFPALFLDLLNPQQSIINQILGGSTMRARKEYTTRKLTTEEQEFASRPENHNLIFKYMNIKRLDPEEFYDELIIDYLVAVKQYVTERPWLQEKFDFQTILFQQLNCAMMHYYRAKNTMMRMPESGLLSLDVMFAGDNPFAEYKAHEEWWIDTKASVERQVILKELYNEFYVRCITIMDEYEETEEICDYLKCELDLLIDGYTRKNAFEETGFRYGRSRRGFEQDVRNFRRIFKQVFGI
jgi:hypothetical protein